jgi:xanthine/CO dehydrogenase XdhC/CoxF family maturation factor
MDDIYSILDVIDRPGGKVLATIIDVEGSAYKKEGSSMIFFEDGTRLGMISAGCLEEDLSIKAAEVLRKGTVTTVHYDMSEEEDFSWGQGAGCNGIVTILLESIDERLKKDLKKLERYLSFNIPVLALKKIDDMGEYLFLPRHGEPFGWWEGEIPEVYFEPKSGMFQDQPIFQHLFRPKPRLIIFGAGPDVKPLVSNAANIGFSIILCDWREEFCCKENFPEVDRFIVGFPKEIFKKIRFQPTDFVILISHNFKHDQEMLLNLPVKRIGYIGVLGPRERTKRLLQKNEIPEWIHSPIGLSIGAKGPEEVAISVMAELVLVWRKAVDRNVEKAWTAQK